MGGGNLYKCYDMVLVILLLLLLLLLLLIFLYVSALLSSRDRREGMLDVQEYRKQ